MHRAMSIRGILGKRSASSNPLGVPTASGTLPGADGVPGPPASKVAVDSGLEDRLESLSQVVAELSARVVSCDEMRGEIAKLKLQLDEERQARKEVQQELVSTKAAHGRSVECFVKLEKKVALLEKGKSPSPPSYAAAVGRDETESLRKSQSQTAVEVNRLQQVVERQDRQSRASNVMLFGLDDDGQRSTAQQVSDCLQAASIPERDRVVRAVRLQGNRSVSTSRPAPVKVVLQSPADASALLRYTRTLRQRCKVGADRDLTPQQTSSRREQQGVVQDLRGLGYVTFWKGDQLFYVHKSTGRREMYTGQLPGRA